MFKSHTMKTLNIGKTSKSHEVPSSAKKKIYPNLAQYLVCTNDDLSGRITLLQKRLEESLFDEANNLRTKINKNHTDLKIQMDQDRAAMNQGDEKIMKQLGNQRELVFRHLQDFEKQLMEHDAHIKMIE